MRILDCIRSDVGIVRHLALGKVRCHLCIGNAVLVLACSGADIREIDERIVPAVVVVACASIESLIAGTGHVLLVGLPCVLVL